MENFNLVILKAQELLSGSYTDATLNYLTYASPINGLTTQALGTWYAYTYPFVTHYFTGYGADNTNHSSLFMDTFTRAVLA